jgi:hypothetical protein
VPLIWVTGNSGAGKSTACERLKSRGELAFDADWDGYSGWADRTTGEVVIDPPDPVPEGWLDRFGWVINRGEVAALAARTVGATAFLCGSAENEADVLDLFDLVVCLVVDDGTLRRRLATRTSNSFGKHPEELAAALDANRGTGSAYRRLGAVIVDGTRPLEEVAGAIVEAAARLGAPG